MNAERPETPSRSARRIGWALSVLFTLFMAFDSIIKVVRLPVVEDTLAGLGYPVGLGFWIGISEVVLVLLYLVPRTSLLGVMLLTGLFGGTMATHIRAGSPLFSHVLFGFYLAVPAWGGLWLRDGPLRQLSRYAGYSGHFRSF